MEGELTLRLVLNMMKPREAMSCVTERDTWVLRSTACQSIV
jgi:hypothetical protein